MFSGVVSNKLLLLFRSTNVGFAYLSYTKTQAGMFLDLPLLFEEFFMQNYLLFTLWILKSRK